MQDPSVCLPFEIKDEVMCDPAPWFQSYTQNKQTKSLGGEWGERQRERESLLMSMCECVFVSTF